MLVGVRSAGARGVEDAAPYGHTIDGAVRRATARVAPTERMQGGAVADPSVTAEP